MYCLYNLCRHVTDAAGCIVTPLRFFFGSLHVIIGTVTKHYACIISPRLWGNVSCDFSHLSSGVAN